jgi:hypothetical protein
MVRKGNRLRKEASEPPARNKAEVATAASARSDRSARRSARFAAEAHRQSLTVANSPHAADDQAFIDSLWEGGEG